MTVKRKAEAAPFDVPILWGTRPSSTRQYRVVECKGSALVGQCSRPGTHHEVRPIMDFCPLDSAGGSRDPRKHAKFLAAVKAYEAAFAARDKEAALKAVALVGDLRLSVCPICRRAPSRSPGYLTPKQQACKDHWNALRRAAGGCAKCDLKGLEPDEVIQVLQANHKDPRGLVDKDNVKIYKLSDYKLWAKGDLSIDDCKALMTLEASKCDFICGVCHCLDPNSSSANRVRNPEELPGGKSSGTPEQQKEYYAKRNAKQRFPKQQFVDDVKIRLGQCQHCGLQVTAENVVAFHFDHKDERTKLIGKGTLAGVQGGVGGLVSNVSKKASLDNIKDILVDEMNKCQLLCANCHNRKTHYGLKIKAD